MKSKFYCIILVFVILTVCSGCGSKNIESNLSLTDAEAIKKHDATMPLIREAMIHFKKGENDQAIDKFSLAREIVPTPLVSQSIGVSYCRKGDYEKGLLYFYEALLLHLSLEEEEIDQNSLMKLLYHIDEAEAELVNQKLEEESHEMITNSIKDALEKI